MPKHRTGGQSLGQQCRQTIATRQNRTTRKCYNRSCNQFIVWTKANGLTAKVVRADPAGALNAYSAALQKQGYTPATIHTYLSGPCVALGVDMRLVKKPLRTAGTISRSRGFGNVRGRQEANDPRFAHSVALARALGIRRAELARLKGTDYRPDSQGFPCVLVRRGKGGKPQWQRVLPQDQPLVASFFDGTEAPVLAPAELSNKIDYHGIRAAHARDAYAYYMALAQTPEGRAQLRSQLLVRFAEGNLHAGAKKRQRFLREMNDTSPRRLRGENLVRALDAGRPTSYDRLALLCVSVFHLSHWRNDVTVTNYML